MIHTLLGPALFRKGMDLYFERHDGEAATVEQFVQCFADVNKRDLKQFMRWYSQAGTPEVVASGHYDAAAKTYKLDLAQVIPPTPGQPTKEPMVIPLVTGLVGRDGRDLPLTLADGQKLERGVLVLDKAAQSFIFTGVTERPVLSTNRNFSAPIRLTANLTRRRSAADGGARQRSVQPLAGGADAGERAPGRQRRAPARRPGPRGGRRPARVRLRRSSPTRRSSPPSSPRR